MADKKTKPLTREDVKAMPHSELASVKTKRRLLASLPSASDAKAETAKAEEADENLSPKRRIERGVKKAEEARVASEGGSDGDED
jgi:hypothetical protein